MPLLHAVARLVFPIYFSFLLIKFAFRCGGRGGPARLLGAGGAGTGLARRAEA